jgi:hypothetical protein
VWFLLITTHHLIRTGRFERAVRFVVFTALTEFFADAFGGAVRPS